MPYSNFDPAYTSKAQERIYIRNGMGRYLATGKGVTYLPEEGLVRRPHHFKYNAAVPKVQAAASVPKKPRWYRAGLRKLLGF